MENNNILQYPFGTIIINGGNALPGCPNDWDEARQIELQLNNGIEKDDAGFAALRWSFDCGFKLDYDGSILRISSRFYPPKTHYGSTWDGTVSLYLMGKEVKEKKFDCSTLDELKKQVEAYVQTVINGMEAALK
jgi:hypothetical protein